MRKARITVVDGSPVAAEGVAAILGRCPGFEIVGVYPTAAGMLASLQVEDPDVVVLDEDLPDLPAALACREIRRRRDATATIVLTDVGEPSPAALAPDMRVLPRSTSGGLLARTVARAIHPAGHGQSPAEKTSNRTVLFARELAVVRLVARGCTNEHIARVLNVSVGTVKRDVRASIAKLGALDRSHLVVVASERRLVR